MLTSMDAGKAMIDAEVYVRGMPMELRVELRSACMT